MPLGAAAAPPSLYAGMQFAYGDEPDPGSTIPDAPSGDERGGSSKLDRGVGEPSEDETGEPLDGSDSGGSDLGRSDSGSSDSRGSDLGGSDLSPSNPDLAVPEQPPGCPDTHQPLELLI